MWRRKAERNVMCLCNAYLQISNIHIMLPWSYNWSTLPSVILLWTMLQGTGENINSYWMEGLGTSVLTFLLKTELSLGAITPPHPGISESYSHSHRAFKRPSEPSWRKPFGLFQSFFHLREDLKLCEAENKQISFEFQHCVVDNENPDYLIAVSEGASVSGHATVTTKIWWLLRGLRSFDKSSFLQVLRNWYWISKDVSSLLLFPLRKTNHMLDPSPPCKNTWKIIGSTVWYSFLPVLIG